MNVTKDPLESIIGDDVRAKLLRLFVLNADFVYTVSDFSNALKKRDQVLTPSLRRLERDGIIRKKKISKADQRNRSISKSVGYGLNKRYLHRDFLERLVKISVPTEKDVLAKKIVRVPGVQCVVMADVFVEKPRNRVDLIVASSEENEQDLRILVQDSERVIGRELRCTFLTVNDLLYRIRMNDRFIRAILEEEGYSVYLDNVGLPGVEV